MCNPRNKKTPQIDKKNEENITSILYYETIQCSFSVKKVGLQLLFKTGFHFSEVKEFLFLVVVGNLNSWQ